MKPHVTIIAALLVICAVSSCSKDKDNASAGTTLTRYTTTFRDTLVYHYIYDRDANNKLIAARDSTKAYEFTTKLEYGNNSKLTKAIFLQGFANPSYTYEFEYNTDGRISKRKISTGDYNVYVYDASGRLTIDSQYTKVNNGTFKPVMVSKFQYTGDNVTEAESYIQKSGGLALDTRVKYEYDNAINPFKNLEYEYYLNEAGSGIFTIQLKCANNMLKLYVADGNGGWNLQQSCTYQYNSNNYAWKASLVTGSPNFPKVDTEYFYQ
jgi:hypothetical protein